MALQQITRKLVEKKLSEFYDKKIPEHARSQVHLKYVIRGNSVTLFEERPDFIDKNIWIDSKVAQFRYNPKDNQWTLYYADRNSKWNEYWDLDPNTDFDVLLQEVEEDPTCIFWG